MRLDRSVTLTLDDVLELASSRLYCDACGSARAEAIERVQARLALMTDGEYWVHVRRHTAEDVRNGEVAVEGRLVDARLDVRGKHTGDCDTGDFANPGLEHLALRIARAEGGR